MPALPQQISGFRRRHQLHAGNRLEQRARLGAHALPVGEMAGVVIRHAGGNRMAGRARRPDFRQHL